MNTKTIESLSPHVFYILLALANKERHGYEIMKHIKEDSQGKMTIGPGTLYGALKRLLQDNWVEEIGLKDLPDKVDERRKYYRLTELGRTQLSAEIQRYQDALSFARKNTSVSGGLQIV